MGESGASRRGSDWEFRELALRRVLSHALPALFALIYKELKSLRKVVSPDDMGLQNFLELAGAIDFLGGVDLKDIEDRICREWLGGDDTLAISLLVLVNVRAHLNIQKTGRLLNKARKSGVKLSRQGRRFFNLIRDDHIRVEALMDIFVENSGSFSKHYGIKDLWLFIREDASKIGDLVRHGVTARRARTDKEFLDRILKKKFESGDRHLLRFLINRQMKDLMSLTELGVIGVFEGRQEVMEEVRVNTASLLRLYGLHKLADEITLG